MRKYEKIHGIIHLWMVGATQLTQKKSGSETQTQLDCLHITLHVYVCRIIRSNTNAP